MTARSTSDHVPEPDRPTKASEQAKSRGALFEALELACSCIELGPGLSLTEKLAQLNVSKDYYYRRVQEFKEYTGLDLSDEIQEQIDADANGIPNTRSNLFTEYRMIRRFYDTLPRVAPATDGSAERRHPRRIRLGASEILIHPLVRPAIRRFHSRPEFTEDMCEVMIDIGVSGDLIRKFNSYKILDLYVSQKPEGESPKDAGVFPSSAMPFWVVCPHAHPAARFTAENPGKPVPAERFEHTTLVLLGYHPRRSPQYVFPIDRIRKLNNRMRVVEVETFALAHNLVASGPSNVAALTVPEFLDEERLRSLTPIPTKSIENFPEINPIELSVIYRRAEPNLLGTGSESVRDELLKRERAVRELAEELGAELHRLADDELARVATEWLGASQHIYYERTSETKARQPFPRGWVHSEVQWRFLKNGCVVGRHTVEKTRPGGRYDGDKTTFDILGRLIRNQSKRGDEYHLYWTGINEHHEGYAASFIIPVGTFRNDGSDDRRSPNPDRNIVGVWVGRRTSGTEFEPSAGYMVIALQPDDWHLTKEFGQTTPPTREDAVLTELVASVGKHEDRFTGLSNRNVARRWEWATRAPEDSQDETELPPHPTEAGRPHGEQEDEQTRAAMIGRLESEIVQRLNRLKALAEQAGQPATTTTPDPRASGLRQGRKADNRKRRGGE